MMHKAHQALQKNSVGFEMILEYEDIIIDSHLESLTLVEWL